MAILISSIPSTPAVQLVFTSFLPIHKFLTYSQTYFLGVSETQGQQRSENIKWKIPEMKQFTSFKLQAFLHKQSFTTLFMSPTRIYICLVIHTGILSSHSITKEVSTTVQILRDHIHVTNTYLFGCAASQLRHVGSSFLTRDQTQGPCIGIQGFQPLDHQGSPSLTFITAIVTINLYHRYTCIRENSTCRAWFQASTWRSWDVICCS